MERAHREPAHGLFAEAVRQAFQHFGGGLTGEGDGGDPGGRDALVLDQPRDAGNERAGFARARPGDDRRAGGLRADGGVLLGVGRGGGVRNGFRRGRGSGRGGPCAGFGAGSRRGRSQQRGLPGEHFDFARRKEGDHAVFAVIARLADHLPGAHAAHALGHGESRLPLDVGGGQLAQDAHFRAKAPDQRDIHFLHPLGRGARAQTIRQHLGQGDEAFKGLGQGSGRGAVGQLLHAAEHADGERPSADGAAPAQRRRFGGFQTALAAPVAVQMVLALLRVKFDGAVQALAGFQRAPQRGVGRGALQHVGLAAQLGGGMRVGVGDQKVAVQHGQAAVHGRVGGKAGFQRVDMAGQVTIAFFQRGEIRKRPKERKVRRPDMGRDEDGLRTAVQRDFQQVAAIQPQNGPPVGMEIADGLQPVGEGFGGFQPRQEDDMMHLARFSAAFIDGADLARHHKARRIAGGFAGQAVFVPEAVEPFLRLYQHFGQLGPPRRVRKIARAQQPDALAPGPQVQMRRVTVAAGGAGIFGMNMQIGNVHQKTSVVRMP